MNCCKCGLPLPKTGYHTTRKGSHHYDCSAIPADEAMRLRLSELVKLHRGKRSLREAAEECGVAAATMYRVEVGILPNLDTFAAICRWTGASPAELLGVVDACAHHPAETALAGFVEKLSRLNDELQASAHAVLSASGGKK